MTPTVRKGPCPDCDIPGQAWIVRGDDGSCWTCTHDFTAALRYAIERSQQGAPCVTNGTT